MEEQQILFWERQRFKQFWLWVLVLGMAGVFWAGFIYQVILNYAADANAVTKIEGVVLFIVLGLGLPYFFYSMSLVTEVLPGILTVRFSPFHLRPVRIPLHLVRDFEKVSYEPIKDYGGWGIRWSFKGKAYNMSGREGVQLYFYNRKPVLIGSQRPKELFEAIAQAKQMKQATPDK